MTMFQILPARGEGDRAKRGGGGIPDTQRLHGRTPPSTMLRMVPLPVPGRI